MAKQVTQRIALSGGEEFRAGLKALGAAGQEAFKNVQDGAKQATITAAEIAPVIDKIQRKFKELKTAAAEVGSSFSEAGAKIKEAGTRITAFVAAATGAAVGFGLMVKNSADAADNVGKTADALGITAQQLQNLQYAAGASNMSTEQFEKGLLKLSATANMSEKRFIQLRVQQDELQRQFARGDITMDAYTEGVRKLQESTTQVIDPFTRLNISVRDQQGNLKNSRQLLFDLADAYARTDDAALKLQITTEIFGTRAGKPFIDLLNQGAAGIAALEREGQRLAPAFNDAEREIGQKFGDTLDGLAKTIDSIRNRFFLLFGPSLTVLMKNFQEFLARNAGSIQEFGMRIAGALRPVFDDLAKLLNGEFIRADGLVAKVRDAVLATAENVKQAVGIIVSVWQAVVSVLDRIANIINSVFGTELTGQALAIVAAFSAVTGIMSAVFAAITAIASVVGLLAAAFGGVEVAIVAAGVAVGYYFGSKLVDDLSQAPEMLVALWNTVKEAFFDMGVGVKVIWNSVMGFLNDKVGDFINGFIAGLRQIKEVIASIPGLGSLVSTGSDNGFAEGGHVRGPGTETSDSILARLSDNEFVIQAKAVRHYGAGLFDALNNMRIPAPQFALGGLVDAISSVLPRTNFATGGMVAAATGPSGRPVILQIGSESFGPLTAGEHTVNKLERYAAGQQMRSAGRKPTWAGK